MPAPKEFKSRSEKPSERFSKMGDGGGRYSSLLPRWPRVRADHSLPRRPGAILESAWHVRAPKRGFVNQATALARPGRLPLVSGPEGDPRPAVSRCPPPPPPRQCHCSLTSRCGPAPRPPPSLPPSLPPPSPPPAPGARYPAASKAPAEQGSPHGPAGAAPPCALPNLPLLFQLPSSPRLQHRGGLQNAEHGAAATPGIRSGRPAEASPARAGRRGSACVRARVCIQPGLCGR